ncbi:MAG: HEAT repeat domain-containing protein, partial [Thermodesulfobacteriota bacterium]
SSPETIDICQAALEDSMKNVRQAAIWGLSQVKQEKVAEILMRIITNAEYDPNQVTYLDDEYQFAYWAAYALIHVGEPALDQVVTMVKNRNNHVYARKFGVFAMHNIMRKNTVYPRGVSCMVDVINEGNEVSEIAASALGLLGDHDPVEPLINALKSTDYHVREQAATSLGKIGDPGAVKPLIAAMLDQYSQCRKEAAFALAEIGDPRSVEALISIIQKKDQDQNVIEWAIEALGKFGDPGAVEPLIALLEHKDKDVCVSAAQALGEIGDSRAVEPLIHAMQDKKNRSADLFADVLGEIGDPKAADALLVLLQDRWPYNCEAAARALGKIGDERAVEPLKEMVEAKRGNVFENRRQFLYREAAEALLLIKKHDTVDILKELEQEDSSVRLLAIYKLAVLKDAAVVDNLTPLLHNRDEKVRKAAVYALGRIGSRKCI